MYNSTQGKGHRLIKIFSFFKQFDITQIVAAAGLLTIGVIFIYGIGQKPGELYAQAFWKKQILWIIIGIGIYILIAVNHYKIFGYVSILLYIISIVLLIAVLKFGIKMYGAQRWLSVGPLRFQPSEIAKLSILLIISYLISLKKFDINKWYNLSIIGILAGIPFFLILKEPDLGSGLVIAPIVCSILFIAGLNWKWIISGMIGGVASIFLTYPFLKEYQKERILVFLDPNRDPLNRGWNALQAELAVGSGGPFGKGFMQGTQHILGFLPKTVSNTDFIFSVIAEETGFLGCALLIFLYILLIYSAIRTAIVCQNKFGRLTATGIAAVLFTHSFVNIGMSIKLMPITGLPLPLVSYGGSFIITTMMYLAILQSIYYHSGKDKLASL